MARERLYASLNRATRLPLTQLIAPAGTGKTVLASSWALAAAHTAPIIWLDSRDHHLLAGSLLRLATDDPAPAPGPTGRSRPPARRPADTTVLRALNARLASGTPPGLLVIDDAHLLDREEVRLLATALSTVPDAVRLLVASRRDLNVPIVELSLHGRATSLRSRQLRFTASEATSLVRAHVSTVGQMEIESLYRRTDGWAAALVLGARTMVGGSPGTKEFLEDTEQPVLDFLLSEAYATLDKPIQDLLLSTFEEAEITGRRAALLSGDPKAPQLLSDLADAGLLVAAQLQHPGEDLSFRYHPLLVELLRRRAARPGEHAAVIAAAHQRAAVCDAEQGHAAEALRHALASTDRDLLAVLTMEHGVGLLCAGELGLVEAALAELSAGDFPIGLFGLAALSRREAGDTAEAIQLAGRSRAAADKLRSAPGTSPAADRLRVDAAVLRLWLARYGWHDIAEAISKAQELLGCRYTDSIHSGHRPRLLVGPERLSWLMIELASAEIWAGDLRDAEAHLDEALVSSRMSGHQRLVAEALAHLSVIQYADTAIRTAGTTARQALGAQPPAGAGGPTSDRALAVRGLAAFHQLDTAAARKWLVELEGSPSVETDVVAATLQTLLRACLLTEQGDLDGARLALIEQPAAPGPAPEFLVRDLAMMRWLCATLAGDGDMARTQLRTLEDVGRSTDVELMAAIAGALAGTPGALDSIEEALVREGSRHPVVLAAATALRVTLLLQAGERERAEQYLPALLNLVAPQQPLQALTPAASDPRFLGLLDDASRWPRPHPFAGVAHEALSRYRTAMVESPLNAALQVSVSPSGTTVPPIPAMPGRYPIRITSRETEVLQQLSLGGSYTEIGDALFITENTVKTHLTSLYRKLGVEKRSAALRVARDRGLL